MNQFSKALKIAMIRNDTSTRDLAEALGMTERHANRLKNNTNPTLTTMLRVARYFNMGLADFIALAGEDE